MQVLEKLMEIRDPRYVSTFDFICSDVLDCFPSTNPWLVEGKPSYLTVYRDTTALYKNTTIFFVSPV